MLYRRPARRPIPPRRPRPKSAAPDRRRRHLFGLLGFVVIAAGIAAGLLAFGGSPGLPPALPATFEVVYKVVNTSTSSPRTTWEVLNSSDPFDVTDLTYTSSPFSGAKPASGTVSTFDHLYNLTAGRLTLVSDRQPGLGSGDQALVPELAQLQQRRLVAPLGTKRQLAGQTCSTYRFSEPPVGPVTPLSGTHHDDLCLSASGLELAERWTYGGRPVLERTAVEVTIGGYDRRITAAPAPPPSTQPAVAVLRIGEPTERSFLATPPTPSGFASTAPLQAVAYDPSNPNQASALSEIWTFRRGGNLVTVEAGEGQYPWNDTGAPASGIHIGRLGPAQAVLKSDGPEIQVQLSGGRWVRVDGTVPLPYLVSYAGRLRFA